MASKNKTSTTSTTVLIRPQHRKSMVMRVSAAGVVVVQIPKWLNPDEPLVRRFIEHGIEKLGDLIPDERTTPLHTTNSIRVMVNKWASYLGLSPGRVQFREMTRKWGSCSINGNITLNTSLFFLPGYLVEYVVVHELVHMMIFNHSPAFWGKLSEYVPDYQAYERELDSRRV